MIVVKINQKLKGILDDKLYNQKLKGFLDDKL